MPIVGLEAQQRFWDKLGERPIRTEWLAITDFSINTEGATYRIPKGEFLLFRNDPPSQFALYLSKNGEEILDIENTLVTLGFGSLLDTVRLPAIKYSQLRDFQDLKKIHKLILPDSILCLPSEKVWFKVKPDNFARFYFTLTCIRHSLVAFY